MAVLRYCWLNIEKVTPAFWFASMLNFALVVTFFDITETNRCHTYLSYWTGRKTRNSNLTRWPARAQRDPVRIEERPKRSWQRNPSTAWKTLPTLGERKNLKFAIEFSSIGFRQAANTKSTSGELNWGTTLTDRDMPDQAIFDKWSKE